MPWRIAEQSSFTVSGMTLLEKLDRHVKESCAVVHLIGMMAGAGAMPQEVAAFLASRPQFLQKHPAMRARSVIATSSPTRSERRTWRWTMASCRTVFVAEDAFNERPLEEGQKPSSSQTRKRAGVFFNGLISERL